MFNSANNIPYIDIRQTLPQYDQEALFAKYTGVQPDLNRKYCSLFRSDKNPGCRFKWHSGILYFVDNVGFNSKLYFNIVDTISVLQGISVKEAINKIITNKIGGLTWEKVNIIKSQSIKPEIRFQYKDWPENNYFGLSPEILFKENVFLVSDYWIGFDGDFRNNSLHNPKQTLCIAYYFPNTNNVKLYFPEKKEYKWYTNCTNEVFGEWKLDEYLNRNDDLIIITKSQKDRLILDYIYGYNAIAPQNEGIDFGHVLSKIKQFKHQLIVFDYDTAGQKFAAKYSEKYDIPWKNIDIGKDVFEIHNKYKYKNIKDYLCNFVNLKHEI